MYIASVLFWCYICCSGYTHIADVCFNCFTLFQYVGTGVAPHILYLAGKHALQGAPAPPGVVPQSMQLAQHICMRAILPLSHTLGQAWCALSLSLSGACALWSLSLSHAVGVSLALGAHALCSLSCIGVRALCSLPLSCMQLGGQKDAWGAEAVGGGVGRSSSRRRRVFQKNKARGGAVCIRRSSMRGRPDAQVHPHVRAPV
jgi:hypothetical protein